MEHPTKKGRLTEDLLTSFTIAQMVALFDAEFPGYAHHRPSAKNRREPWKQALLRAQADWIEDQELKKAKQLSFFDLLPSATEEKAPAPAAFTGEPPLAPETAPLPPAPPAPPSLQPPAADRPDEEDEIVRGRVSELSGERSPDTLTAEKAAPAATLSPTKVVALLESADLPASPAAALPEGGRHAWDSAQLVAPAEGYLAVSAGGDAVSTGGDAGAAATKSAALLAQEDSAGADSAAGSDSAQNRRQIPARSYGIIEQLLAVSEPERLGNMQQLIAECGFVNLRERFKEDEHRGPYLEQLLESAIAHLRAESAPQADLPLPEATPKGKQRPITPWVISLSERFDPYGAPRLFAHSALCATKSTLRLKGGSYLFPEDFTAHQHKIYCLPDEGTWKRALSLQSEFDCALEAYGRALASLGNYSVELAKAGGLSKVESPLTPTVVRCWEFPREAGVESFRSSDLVCPPWSVPAIERLSIYRHTKSKIQVGAGAWGLMQQVDFWLCPDDAAWEALKTIRAAAVRASQELQQFLCQKGTYRDALADGRYSSEGGKNISIDAGVGGSLEAGAPADAEEYLLPEAGAPADAEEYLLPEAGAPADAEEPPPGAGAPADAEEPPPGAGAPTDADEPPPGADTTPTGANLPRAELTDEEKEAIWLAKPLRSGIVPGVDVRFNDGAAPLGTFLGRTAKGYAEILVHSTIPAHSRFLYPEAIYLWKGSEQERNLRILTEFWTKKGWGKIQQEEWISLICGWFTPLPDLCLYQARRLVKVAEAELAEIAEAESIGEKVSATESPPPGAPVEKDSVAEVVAGAGGDAKSENSFRIATARVEEGADVGGEAATESAELLAQEDSAEADSVIEQLLAVSELADGRYAGISDPSIDAEVEGDRPVILPVAPVTDGSEAVSAGTELVSSERGRHSWDFYQSPAWYGLVALKVLPLSGTVIEPCAGDGAISSVLEAAQLTVVTNDLNPEMGARFAVDAAGGDWSVFPRAEWVVTNPPFGEAFSILEKAWEHATVGVAMFLRQTFPEPTEARGRWLSKHPPTHQFHLPRFKFRQGKSGKWATDCVTVSLYVWAKQPLDLPPCEILLREQIPLFYSSPEEAPSAEMVFSRARTLAGSDAVSTGGGGENEGKVPAKSTPTAESDAAGGDIQTSVETELPGSSDPRWQPVPHRGKLGIFPLEPTVLPVIEGAGVGEVEATGSEPESKPELNAREAPETGKAKAKPGTYPYWLSPIQLEQADALLRLDFIFVGDSDEEGWLSDECARAGEWVFFVAPGEVYLDAEINGALYSLCLETREGYSEDDFFVQQLEASVRAIEETISLQESREGVQLTLFPEKLPPPGDGGPVAPSLDPPEEKRSLSLEENLVEANDGLFTLDLAARKKPLITRIRDSWKLAKLSDSEIQSWLSQQRKEFKPLEELSLEELRFLAQKAAELTAPSGVTPTGQIGDMPVPMVAFGQRVAVALKSGRQTGTVNSEPYRPEGISCLVVRVRMDAGGVRNCPLDTLEPLLEGASETPGGEKPEAAGPLSIQDWARELRGASSGDEVLQLADRYKLVFSSDYDDRRSELWAALDQGEKVRIKSLLASSHPSPQTQLEAGIKTPTSENFSDPKAKQKTEPPELPPEFKWLGTGARVKEWVGLESYRYGTVVDRPWIQRQDGNFIVWRVRVRWDFSGKEEEREPLYLDPEAATAPPAEAASAEAEAASAEPGAPSAELAGVTAPPTEAASAESGAPSAYLAGVTAPPAEAASAESEIHRQPVRSSRLSELRKQILKYEKLARIASKTGCRRCAAKWRIKALRLELQTYQEGLIQADDGYAPSFPEDYAIPTFWGAKEVKHAHG